MSAAPTSETVALVGYVSAGSCALFVWDILGSLREDFIVAFQLNFRPSLIPYFISRSLMLVYAVGFAVYSTRSLGDCSRTLLILQIIYALATWARSTNFLLRVRAVYALSRLITFLFFAPLLVVVAASITAAFGIHGAPSTLASGDPACVVSRIAPFVGSTWAIQLAYDTAVFIAISFRLSENTKTASAPRGWERVRIIVSGTGPTLYTFSRNIMRDGWWYFLMSLLANTMLLVAFYNARLEPALKAALMSPAAVVQCIWAGRVYRNAKVRHQMQSEVLSWSTPD
ncbi:unnamed protein product [Mycena citricolor]|uniref:Uncharacterized protein n=1 Tax=Mycena citricolor TaxID=2018698 RepID=A0AAD2Q1S4_9AGAR|nr:unnamed protein product [Mycena citricolor]